MDLRLVQLHLNAHKVQTMGCHTSDWAALWLLFSACPDVVPKALCLWCAFFSDSRLPRTRQVAAHTLGKDGDAIDLEVKGGPLCTLQRLLNDFHLPAHAVSIYSPALPRHLPICNVSPASSK